MEHFLPLAIASMVISLISIILLDYFGPKSSTSDQESLATTSDAYESTEEHQVIPEDTTKEIALEQEHPIRSNNPLQPSNDSPSIIQFYILNKFANFNTLVWN